MSTEKHIVKRRRVDDRTQRVEDRGPDSTPAELETRVIEEEYAEDDLHDPAGDHDDVVQADEESVVYAASAWDVARGWVRTLSAWIGLALLFVETLLAFRLGFLLANANPNNDFVDLIYDASAPLIDPFEGIASESAAGDGIFEPATLIAMIVYLVAALLLIFLIWTVTAGPSAAGERRIARRSSLTHTDAHEHR